MPWHMRGGRRLGALLIVAWLILGPSQTAFAEHQQATATALPTNLSAQQAHDLITLLNDPTRRNQLVGELEALEKVAPSAAPAAPVAATAEAAPPAAAKPAPASPVAAVAHAVTKTGLLSQLVLATPRFAYGAFGQFAALRHVLSGVPASWQWLVQTLGDAAAREMLMRVALGLAAVLAPALLVWFGLRWLLRPRRARLGRLAAPDSARETATQERKRLSVRLSGASRWLCFALLAFLMDAAPVAAFAAVGYVLTPSFTDPGMPQVLVLDMVEALTVFGAVLCITRALVAPDIAALRVFPMQDRTAAATLRWVGWLTGIAVFGMAILNAALLLGLDPAAQVALKKLVLLVDHVLLVVLVLSHRRAIAAHLRSPKRRNGVLAGVVTGLAEVWHIVAVVLIMGLWVIWAADWQGGYTRLLQFIAAAVAVGTVTRLLTEGLLIVLRHVLHVGDDDAHGTASLAFATGRRSRAARYYPVLSAGISVVMAATGLLVLLELCGVSSIGWLLGTTLGWQMVSAVISIAVTLCVAVVAWEAVNIGVERHLDRLSRQAQMARAARLRTLLPMMRTAVAVSILVVVVLTVLSQVGINIAPLLAGAGIVGVAIGFGSQKLVQDLITGLFLLLEDAMQVGDWVTLAGVSGSVEQLSIRTIRLRGGDGSLYIIPFSSVTMVNNTNRGLGNASVSVTVAAREDPDEVGDVLKAIVGEMREDAKFKPMILSDLQFWGVDKVDGASMVLAGQIVCTDSGRWGVQREFNRRYKKRFAELGIEIPNPTQTLLLRHGTPARPPVPSQPEAAGQSTATVAASPPSAM